MFNGLVSRQEVVNYFEVGLSAATRDLTLYKELAPNNLEYATDTKRYSQREQFQPIFEHDARQVLARFAYKISDGVSAGNPIAFSVEAPNQLNVPQLPVVSKAIQAISQKRAIKVSYSSLTSGLTVREIVPHTLVDNGLRWHLRAFDRKSESFRDFVLTRISKIELLDSALSENEGMFSDHQWTRIVDLDLVPHPKNIMHPEVIIMDYGMNDGALQLKVRAAMAGYLLRRWNVDCSSKGSLKGPEYHLWLRNRNTLYGVKNLLLAPGYIEDDLHE